MQFLNHLVRHPLLLIVSIFFLVVSWPFSGFPLTDGDIAHWVDWAYEMARNGNFLAAESDQSHGPLLAWGTALFITIFSLNFYTLNLFNGLCGMGCVLLVYVACKGYKLEPNIRLISTTFTAINFVMVYLSRTPMYDLPAAFGYMLFCVGYAFYAKSARKKWLVWIVLGLMIGVISRFMIVLGLAGFFVLVLQFFIQPTRRDWFFISFFHGLMMAMVAIVAVFPWVYVQNIMYPDVFLNEFLYDNFFRFFGDENGHSNDYYGFILTAFVGLLPVTPMVVSALSPSLWKLYSNHECVLFFLAMSVPCLFVFSLSGHTKLLRYISYVFPGFLALSGYLYGTLMNHPVYLKRLKKWYIFLLVVVSILLATYASQFSAEANESIMFVISSIILLLGLIGGSYYFTVIKRDDFIKNPLIYFGACSVLYIMFFSVLANEYQSLSFLMDVRDKINYVLFP